MGRKSTNPNPNIYEQARNHMNLTREEASEVLEFLSDDRIEKIEHGKAVARPEEVLQMAIKYKMPELKNYYCVNECSLGKDVVPQVTIHDLPRITLELLTLINTIEGKQQRLMEIATDEKITDDELADFAAIQENLEHISMTVSALDLWSERMIAEGYIDEEKLKNIRQKK